MEKKKNNDDPLNLLSKDPLSLLPKDPLSLLQHSVVCGSKDSIYRALKP